MAYTIASFAKFCGTLTTTEGKPMRLEPFQKSMLADFFAGTTATVIVIPKKNGKTTLLGALALFHLLEVPNADCVIGAASRDQATLLFNQAAQLVEDSKWGDTFQVKGGYRQIRLASRPSSRIRVLAADANTADGVIPTLALVDELHRHPSGELYGVFRDGLVRPEAQMITISTAGASLASPLGLLRTAAHKLPGFTRDEKAKRNYVKSANGDFVLHEWCLSPDDDPGDIRLVKKANPASFQTLKKLSSRHDDPATTPWQWLRFACGVWTEGEEPWIDPGSWDGLGDPSVSIPEGHPAWLGVDLGVRHDSTAIVAASFVDDLLVVRATIMAPGDSGIALQRVENEIRAQGGRYRLLGVAYDPWSFRRSAEILEAEGLPMVEFPQSPERMSQASATLYRVIEERILRHDGDPILRAHVMGGVTKETERGWRLVKDPRQKRPIDALIALAIAAYMATSNEVERKPLFAFS